MSDEPAIFVIDDNDEFRTLLGELLDLKGHRTQAFASAEEALTHIRDGARPTSKLVISDINMEGVSGLAFTRELARLAPQLPIILMSAFGGRERAEEAAAAGATAYINKPFPLPDLTALVQRVLEGMES
ncbi:MAG: response regulator [Deltaproteobacteria bacterium]|nr:response regulator [Deltaproteobacteria bacterium]